MYMLTAEQIRELREKLGLTPTGFGAMLGVSDNTVRRWELGDRNPKHDTMVRLNELAKEHGIDLGKGLATAS
jgi:DNA-binding transcriptional regulator YiaG